MFWYDFIAYPKIKTLHEYSKSEGTDTFIGIFWYCEGSLYRLLYNDLWGTKNLNLNPNPVTGQGRGAHIVYKSISHLKMLGSGQVTYSEFHTEDPQIVCNSTEFSHHSNQCLWFVQPWVKGRVEHNTVCQIWKYNSSD
jgi:hypothetical protein